MNTGVEILLQRMKDCPEDFAYQPATGMTRWGRLVDHAVSAGILTTEELDAIKLAQLEASRERFTELVMKELAGEGEASDEGKTPSHIAHPIAMPLGGVTLGAYSNTSNVTTTLTSNSLTLGQTQLKEEQVKHMIAHLDWLKREEQLKKQAKQKHWWNKTIPELLGKK